MQVVSTYGQRYLSEVNTYVMTSADGLLLAVLTYLRWPMATYAVVIGCLSAADIVAYGSILLTYGRYVKAIPAYKPYVFLKSFQCSMEPL